MRQILNKIEQLINLIMALSIAGMSILIFTNVILRYAFHTGITWAEEMSRFMFIWMVFLGSILALKDGTHIGMDILVRRVPEKLRKILLLIGNFIILVISFIILSGSLKMTADSIESKAPATGLSLSLMYGVGIIMSLEMILISTMKFFMIIKSGDKDNEDTGKD